MSKSATPTTSSSDALPSNIAKNLIEKRKQAGEEIEALIKKYRKNQDEDAIRELLKCIKVQFIQSVQPSRRKGGLWGLAAACIGLTTDTHLYLDDLIPPVLKCFSDQDSKIRFHACEAAYNIAKIARGSILIYFNEIFDGLCRLCADSDNAVKNASVLLNRLIKDIISEDDYFNVEKVIPLIKERISTNNPYVRQFLIGWIVVLDSVPDINMVEYLPEFLSGLFEMLSDLNKNIVQQASSALSEFLHEIDAHQATVDFGPLVKIVIAQCTSRDTVILEKALSWVNSFHVIAKEKMLPYNADFLGAVLPCISHKEEVIRKSASAASKKIMKLVKHTQEPVAIGKLIAVIKIELHKNSVPTRIAALHWVHMLLNKDFNEVMKHIDELFALLMDALTDPSEEVVVLDLEVLALISTTEHNFGKFLSNLVRLFRTNPKMLSKAGFILRKLSVMLNPEKIYRELAKILLNEPHLEFCNVLIQTINTILLTSKELAELRALIKSCKTSEQGMDLFTVLYKSWSHNPVSTLSLCLLAKAYEHAAALVVCFSEIEVSVSFLVQIDNLVQFLESPIFAELRLHLLEPHKYPDLLKALYGVLMLLPQSTAYDKLSKRLQCVSTLASLQLLSAIKQKDEKILDTTQFQQEKKSKERFNELLQHFKDIQAKHAQFKTTEV